MSLAPAIARLSFLILVGLLSPSAWPLTSGLAQPEFRAFSGGSTQIVDPFTGDLVYTIPLMEIPGPGGSYPLLLSYRSGITMEQEASWVGLGWSLSTNAISRQVRGLPDDFHITASELNPGTCLAGHSSIWSMSGWHAGR